MWPLRIFDRLALTVAEQFGLPSVLVLLKVKGGGWLFIYSTRKHFF